MGSERRRAPRYPIIADAEVTEIASEAKLSARTSDLSAGGCFWKCWNPRPKAQRLRSESLAGYHIYGTRKSRVSVPQHGDGCYVHERPGQSAGRSGKMARRVESRRMIAENRFLRAWKPAPAE